MTTTIELTEAEARQLTDRIKAGFAEIYRLQIQAPARPRTQPTDDIRSVYFIQAANGLIKIGVSGDPTGRLKTLRTMSPVPLRLLAVISGAGAPGEAELHTRFANLRQHGEWFRPDPELLGYIKENS